MVETTTIKKGYKQTEVGVIPEDWEVKKFIDITKVITCGTAATPKYVNESIGKPFFSAQNVQNGKVIYNKYKHIPIDLFEQITKHNLPEKGDLLYTRVGAGIGEAGVIEKDLKFAIYVSLTLIKTDISQIHNYYLLHLLNSPKFKDLAKNGQFAGGGVQNLNVNVVREFLIPLPSIKEQTAIATVLSDTDALIEYLEKLIAKKKDIKQGTMQELLTGNKRLPGFSGDWEEKKLGDISKISRGASPRPIDSPVWFNAQSNVGWLRISDATKAIKYLYSTIQKLSDKGIKNSRYVPKNNLVMSICATIGLPIITKIDVCIHDGFVVFNDTKIDKEYLYYFLAFIQNDWSKTGQTGSQMNLNTNMINNKTIKMPKDLPEQEAIATTLSNIDSEIYLLEQQLKKYIMLKQGMMQELLTGRIRIYDTK